MTEDKYSKFSTYHRSFDFKFFKGKLHQKATAPNPGQVPDHAWIPIESHDEDAPEPGELIGARTDEGKAHALHQSLSKAHGLATTGEKPIAVAPGSEQAHGPGNPEPLIPRTAGTPAAPGYPASTAGTGEGEVHTSEGEVHLEGHGGPTST